MRSPHIKISPPLITIVDNSHDECQKVISQASCDPCHCLPSCTPTTLLCIKIVLHCIVIKLYNYHSPSLLFALYALVWHHPIWTQPMAFRLCCIALRSIGTTFDCHNIVLYCILHFIAFYTNLQFCICWNSCYLPPTHPPYMGTTNY